MGAAIAAGSQLEKGIWALLVMAAATIAAPTTPDKLFWGKLKIFQSPSLIRRAIEVIRRASPIRLDKAVIIPAPRDLRF